MAATEQDSQHLPSLAEGRRAQVITETDPRQKALAMGLEFSKRALEAESLSDLFFILTNDLRALVEFDRASLVTYVGGRAQFSASTNQPVTNPKSKFYQNVRSLAEHLKGVDKGLYLSAAVESQKIPDEDLSLEVREGLKSFMEASGCQYFLSVPLNHRQALVGHLLLEFFETKAPSQVSVLTLLNMAPFFAAALTEQLVEHKKPGIYRKLVEGRRVGAGFLLYLSQRLLLVAAIVGLLSAVLFIVPFPYNVGGEAEVVPRDRHVAFSKIDGLVVKVLVTEGSVVKRGEVLARLDRKELDFEIQKTAHQFEILTKEMTLLLAESGEKPGKIAESKIIELKRKSAWEELQYLKWKSQFLEIVSPVGGIVMTKDIDSLAGKRFKAGEPFCEIAVPGELWVDTYVPEERISLVKIGQPGNIYLNSEPSTGYGVKVAEIAPMAEALPRLGNVYRVRAPFSSAPRIAKVGMKGIGKIEVATASLWHMIAQRLRMRWNQFSLYL